MKGGGIMKRRWWIAGIAVLLLAGLLWQGLGGRTGFSPGERPFRDLEAADLIAVSVELLPPDVTVTLDAAEQEELAGLLREVVIYQRDDSITEYAGQSVIFTLALADGSTRTVVDFYPFLVLDDVSYRTEYAPCEALNGFANSLLEPHGAGG